MAATARRISMCAVLVMAGVPACTVDTPSAPNAKTSCAIETNALKASFSFQTRGAETQIYAAVFSDGNIELGCGDAFAATIGGSRTVLQREAENERGPVHYRATIPAPTIATTATLAFERTNPKIPAPASKAFIPPPFAVRDLSTNVKVSTGGELKFRMEPPIENVTRTAISPDTVQLRLELEGTCLDGVQRFAWQKPTFVPPRVDADGTVTLVNMNQLLRRKGTETGCDVTLRIVTVTAGEVDPAFAGPLDGPLALEASRHEQASFHLDW